MYNLKIRTPSATNPFSSSGMSDSNIRNDLMQAGINLLALNKVASDFEADYYEARIELPARTIEIFLDSMQRNLNWVDCSILAYQEPGFSIWTNVRQDPHSNYGHNSFRMYREPRDDRFLNVQNNIIAINQGRNRPRF